MRWARSYNKKTCVIAVIYIVFLLSLILTFRENGMNSGKRSFLVVLGASPPMACNEPVNYMEVGAAGDGISDIIEVQRKGEILNYFIENNLQNHILRITAFVLLLIALVSVLLAIKYRKLSKELEVSVKERTRELLHMNEILKSTNLMLERISTMDGLTSIENRRAFDTAYDKAWKTCLKERMPLALIMIDIDNFKEYNDTYGHLSGDQALTRIAEVIKGVIKRPGDLAARYGGEEFVVMLMNTVAERAAVVAEEIRSGIEDLGIENEKLETVITVSLGVASVVPENRMEPKELINAADRALYKAKEDGRNKVVVWDCQQK